MRDPLHEPGGPDIYWTTINAEENLAGVARPLDLSFWLGPGRKATLGSFADMGVIRESEVRYSDDPNERIGSVIYGRYCINLNLVRRLADMTPGTSGDAMETQLFGGVREGVESERAFRRYPVVIAKAPRAASGVAKRVSEGFAPSQAWWRRSIDELAGADAAMARGKLAEAVQHMTERLRPHVLGTIINQGVLDEVSKLAARAGRPGLELSLSRGLGGLEEVGMLDRLWRISRGEGSVDTFVEEYGFHGPGESGASKPVWREHPAMLEPILASYRGMPEERSPRAAAGAVAADRAAAVDTLMAALPAWRRPGARFLLRFGDRLWPQRETGKATLLHAIDVGRASARLLGEDMARRGVFDSPEDSAFLTADELIAGEDRDWREEVALRRERYEEYADYVLPEAWTGVPDVTARGDATEDVRELTGIGASPGAAEGRVRVIRDAAAAEIADGEVLVCESTDPSWAALFLPACAVVTDVGSRSSHGAIVSRELGLPCVVNTRSGTRALRDGDLVRVDGDTGRVTVLEQSATTTKGSR